MRGTSISILAQWAARVKLEPRKAAALAILLSVMGLMWAKVLLRDKALPAPAAASPLAPASQLAPEGSMRQAQLSEALKALQEWKRSPVSVTHRNLFSVNLDYFAQDGAKTVNEEKKEREGFWDQVAKSLAAKADQEKARRILIENLRAQASKLDLESTVMSSESPKALVNGNLIGEGDVVAGFRVVRIEAKGIIVEKEGVRLEVLFKF